MELSLIAVLSREQRLEKRKRFITSDQFGATTWMSLIKLNQNIRSVVRLVELEGILIEEINAGTWQTKYRMSDEELRETIQMAYLDAISKLMMCVEDLFALIYAVQRSKKRIPYFLARYEMSQIEAVLRLIQDEKRLRVFLWRILGLPNLKYLGLDRARRKIVREVLDRTVEITIVALHEIGEFYVDHHIAYSKFKHGLSVLVGPQQSERVGDLVFVFDRNEDRPRGDVEETGERSTSFGWYNTLQIIPYNQPAIGKITRTLQHLKTLVFIITNNHLTWAENCGEDYLPAERVEDKAHALVYGDISPEVKDVYEKVWLRVGENMVLPTRSFQFKYNIDNAPQQVRDRLEKGRSSTIWRDPHRESGPYLDDNFTLD